MPVADWLLSLIRSDPTEHFEQHARSAQKPMLNSEIMPKDYCLTVLRQCLVSGSLFLCLAYISVKVFCYQHNWYPDAEK